jgi:hypothetical protein
MSGRVGTIQMSTVGRAFLAGSKITTMAYMSRGMTRWGGNVGLALGVCGSEFGSVGLGLGLWVWTAGLGSGLRV